MAAILPEILAISVRQAIHIKTGIAISVGKLFDALAVLQSVAELTLIKVT